MAQRTKIGLLYSYNENWIGGTYYIENLVCSFNCLEPDNRPIVKIYTKSIPDFDRIQRISAYPFLQMVLINSNYNLVQKGINKLSTIFFKKHFAIHNIDRKVDVFFPHDPSFFFSKIKPMLAWVPDLQEFNNPKFFDQKELNARHERNLFYLKNRIPILFSSHSALRDFNECFETHEVSKSVVPFAVTHPSIDHIKPESILSKYEIRQSFYLCSNQFWIHKNHELVIRACYELKQLGHNVHIVFTGKEYDNRAPTLASELKQLAAKLGLQDNIIFLGFIDRIDQLILMKEAIAIIQPSLSEGWSTVIEDSKALNKIVLASDINVHKEQLDYNVSFFDPLSVESLVNSILSIQSIKISNINYNENVYNFANNYLNIIEKLIV